MENIDSLYERKIDKMLAKMLGDGASELKAIMKLSMMNKGMTEDIERALIDLRGKHEMELAELTTEMEMTLDASGNVVPVAQSLTASPH